MKKFLVGLLAITASVCCALGISACGSNDKDKEKADEWGTVFTVQSAYAKATELGYTGTLEEFIASISGTDGTNGEDGEDGVGISSVTINKDGQLVIVLSDKTELNLGKVVGEDGEDGLGISKVEINDKGEIPTKASKTWVKFPIATIAIQAGRSDWNLPALRLATLRELAKSADTQTINLRKRRVIPGMKGL